MKARLFCQTQLTKALAYNNADNKTLDDEDNEELVYVPTEQLFPPASANQEQSAIYQRAVAAKELESSLVTNLVRLKLDKNVKLINEMNKGDKNKQIKSHCHLSKDLPPV